MKQYKVQLKGVETMRTRKVEPGMTLARPAHTRDGRLILKGNQRLDEDQIEKLESFGVQIVSIRKPQERWFTGRKLEDFEGDYTILEEREIKSDDADKSNNSDGKEISRKKSLADSSVEEMLNELQDYQEAARSDDVELDERVREHISQLFPLIKQKKNLLESVDDEVESEKVRNRIKNALHGVIKHLDEDFLDMNASKDLIEDTMEYVNEREDVRNEIVDTVSNIEPDRLQIGSQSDKLPQYDLSYLRKTYDLAEDEIDGKIKSWFERVLERVRERDEDHNEILDEIMDLVEDPDERKEWFDFFESDCTDEDKARERFFTSDIDSDRAHLFQSILKQNQSDRNIEQTIDRLLKSCRDHDFIDEAREKDYIDPKFDKATQVEVGEPSQGDSDNPENGSPSIDLGKEDYRAEDSTSSSAEKSEKVKNRLNQYIGEDGISTSNVSTLPGIDSQDALDESNGNTMSEVRSEIDDSPVEASEGASIHSVEKLIELKRIPDEVAKNLKELLVIPSDVDKRQNRVMKAIKGLILKMAKDEYVDDNRIENLHDTLSRFFDKERKFSRLLYLPLQNKEYLLPHSYNTLLITIHLTNYKSLNRADEIRLTKSIITRDVGLAYLPRTMVFPDDDLSPRARVEYSKHPLYSAHFASNVEGFDDTEIDLVQEHHERSNGTGYPGGLRLSEQQDLSGLIQVATRYTELCEGRTFRDSKKPDTALEQMRSTEGKFQKSWCRVLERKLGYYPNGSVVLLSNGQISVVRKQNDKDPRSPVVLSITDEHQDKLEDPQVIDLLGESLDAERCLRI